MKACQAAKTTRNVSAPSSPSTVRTKVVKHEKIVDRIRKLLALSESSNEHEAANAAAQAARLMAKHGIESVETADPDLDPVGDNSDLFVEIGRGKRMIPWKWNLATVVAEAGQCKPYALHRKAGDQILGLMIAFIGRRSDAETCCYLYLYLINELRRFHAHRRPSIGSKLQQYVPGKPSPVVDREFQRRWSRDFYAGAIGVLYQRMIQAREEVLQTASSKALVFLGSVAAAVDAVAEDLGLQYVKARPAQIRSEHGYTAGVMAGREIDLSSSSTDPVHPMLPEDREK